MLDAIGSNERVGDSCYLLAVLRLASHLEGVFAIHEEVGLRGSVFDAVLIGELIDEKGFSLSALVHPVQRQGLHQVAVLHVNFVGALHLLQRYIPGI